MVSYNSRAESQDPNDESSRKTFTRYRSPTSYRVHVVQAMIIMGLLCAPVDIPKCSLEESSRTVLLDLAPCDFFLFPKLKKPMKGRRYAAFDEIKTASKEELKNI
ncbi:hypothetical protein LAZ67_15000748 [Cordylochernes scorpioides]|uniref:Uncharacterized protein n=1 Tax=Cordylochernes scorpioides TaxID=51811 RepID=A0ABY6LCE2_9ARAC|nr:hypothetical protein LAZ67_15000748 [Cordylochernes scorpioides]